MNNTLYYHGKTLEGQRFTIAGKYVNNYLHLALSACNPKDSFVKQTGRRKSYGRLLSEKGQKGLFVFNSENIIEGEEIKNFLRLCKSFSLLKSRSLRKLFNIY